MRQQDLFTSVEKFWHRHCVSRSSVCVAVSGGSDSVALFYVLLALKRRLGITRLGIAHVNHRLRGRDSERDAAFVRRIACDAGAAFHLKEIDRKDIPESGVEEWARNRRYAFFDRVLKKGRYRYLATAHTMNDQAETVVMRIMRGSGLHGFGGILPARENRIIRPLLTIGKSDLREWLAEKKLGFREDATNADISFTRNWVRHKFIPLLGKKGPGALERLCSIAENARAITEIIRPLINKWISKHVFSRGATRFLVKKAGFKDETIGAEALATFLRDKKIRFDSVHLDDIVKHQFRSNGVFLLPGGWRYKCGENELDFFQKESSGKSDDFHVELKTNGTTRCRGKNCKFVISRHQIKPERKISFSDPMTAWLDADALTKNLVFRSWKKGEKFWPFGGRKFVDVNEFLKKQGIRMQERHSTGVMAEKAGEIVWIPGQRIGHRFRITPSTRKAVKISCKPAG